MLRQDRLIGIIEVLNKLEGDSFTDDDIDILMVLSGLAAIAIENAHLYQKNLQAERLAVLGQAVANISHYIKNVLTGLKGSITLIESAVEDEEYEILKKATLVMKRSYGRIATLVKDMLSYSKGRDPSPVETDVNAIVMEIRELMIDSANAKEIELETLLDPTIPIVLIDPEILEGVLLNLLTNGIDAVYEWRQANPHVNGKISVSTSYRDGMLTIRVSDNGPGVPRKDRSRIFVAFYTTKGSSGTGLGLAVSKKLVEENGGSLVLHSEEGKGTTFELHYPAPKV
jgi:signal transduction histidine kinase